MTIDALAAEIRANLDRGEELERLITAGIERGQALNDAASADLDAANQLPWWRPVRKQQLRGEAARKQEKARQEVRGNDILLAERQTLIAGNCLLLKRLNRL